MISIIIPVYKTRKYIRQCIDSICKQNFKDWEVILVSDGDPDNSLNEIVDIIKNNKKFIVINKLNGGPGSARNAGLNRCSGEYVVFIDSDDYVNSNYLQVLYETITEYKADVVICGYKTIDCSNSKVGVENNFMVFDSNKIEILKKTEAWTYYYDKNSNKSFAFIVPWGKIYKKTIFKSVRFKETRALEDEYTSFHLYECCSLIVAVPYCLYTYRVNVPNSLASINQNDYFRAIPLLERNICFIKKHYNKKLWYVNFSHYVSLYRKKPIFKYIVFSRLFKKYVLLLVFNDFSKKNIKLLIASYFRITHSIFIFLFK